MSTEDITTDSMAKNSLGTVLVDICGTIYDSNTTFDFLDYHIKKKSYILFRRISKTLPWRIVNRILLSYFQTDLTRTIAFRYLKNIHKNTLLELASDFYKKELKHKKNIETIDLITFFKQNNYQLILTSATLDFIAAIIARENNIETYTATELEYKNDICQGKIKNDHWGHKLQYLKKNNIHPPYHVAITDNYSDIDILKNSYQKIIIINTQSGKAKWDKIILAHHLDNVQFIDVRNQSPNIRKNNRT